MSLFSYLQEDVLHEIEHIPEKHHKNKANLRSL